jgi:hypothetical protein
LKSITRISIVYIREFNSLIQLLEKLHVFVNRLTNLISTLSKKMLPQEALLLAEKVRTLDMLPSAPSTTQPLSILVLNALKN